MESLQQNNKEFTNIFLLVNRYTISIIIDYILKDLTWILVLLIGLDHPGEQHLELLDQLLGLGKLDFFLLRHFGCLLHCEEVLEFVLHVELQDFLLHIGEMEQYLDY